MNTPKKEILDHKIYCTDTYRYLQCQVQNNHEYVLNQENNFYHHENFLYAIVNYFNLTNILISIEAQTGSVVKSLIYAFTG